MGDVPAPAPRFGRAPGAWPLLGHMVALQRRTGPDVIQSGAPSPS
jgi:hypothetical protein